MISVISYEKEFKRIAYVQLAKVAKFKMITNKSRQKETYYRSLLAYQHFAIYTLTCDGIKHVVSRSGKNTRTIRTT